jgi:carboxylate-amine ligase
MSKRKSHDFGFGLETEFLLIDQMTGTPRWENSLQFSKLNALLESIPFEDIGDLSGLELEAPHRKVMPFVVEGYGVPDAEFKVVDVRPKGLEIRTPVSTSLDECLDSHAILFHRMQTAIRAEGLAATTISHHPTETQFVGPQNKRRHDFWRWAMQAMTTFGPDVNVSVPHEVAAKLDFSDLERKVDAYAPALAAFSVASPFFGGKLWRPYEHAGNSLQSQIGKSIRSWRRSVVAPPIEIHPEEDGRLEFKVFEMSPLQSDYRNYFLLFLTLLLDETLTDRADVGERIYALGSVAAQGLRAPEIEKRAATILERARVTLPTWGFSAHSLKSFESRFDRKRVPADSMIEAHLNGQSIEKLLLARATLIDDDSIDAVTRLLLSEQALFALN